MPLRLLLSLSLLLLTVPAACAQTAEDFFHSGAMFYLSNNIPLAKQQVTNGLALFPDNIPLKKLEELLNQKQQSQQQQQQQSESKPDEPKDENKQPQPQKPQESKDEKQKPEEQSETSPHAMTPQEAKQLLDNQKSEEQVLQFRPPDKPNKPRRTLKDW